MRRFSLFVVVVLCLPKVVIAQTKESVVPAGTLLQCTLDEPRFSSETAQVGDPVVCHVSSLGMFGRPIFPRGAYLSGRFEDFHDPGHFFGKGWLKLEFESLTLPGGTFPVSAKVVSVPHYRVDAEGNIRGRGHPRSSAPDTSVTCTSWGGAGESRENAEESSITTHRRSELLRWVSAASASNSRCNAGGGAGVSS